MNVVKGHHLDCLKNWVPCHTCISTNKYKQFRELYDRHLKKAGEYNSRKVATKTIKVKTRYLINQCIIIALQFKNRRKHLLFGYC